MTSDHRAVDRGGGPDRTAYNQWTQFEEFPRFMEGVERVDQLDDRRLHWVASFGGETHEWDAEITEQAPRGAGRLAQHRRQGQRRRRDVPQDRRRHHARDGPDGLGARGHQGEGRRRARRGRPRVKGDLERFKEFIETRGTGDRRVARRGPARGLARSHTTRAFAKRPSLRADIPRCCEGHNALVAVIALIDGEHHPSAVRDVLDGLDAGRGLAGVVFCGGEEKLTPGSLSDHYGRAVETRSGSGPARLASRADAVVDLADEPVLGPGELQARRARAPARPPPTRRRALRLDPPRYEPVGFDGPKLAVIGTGKRTGKTAWRATGPAL